MTQGTYEVTILAKPLEIPSALEADCSILIDLETYFLAKDLNIPEGAELTSDPESQIAWIQPPRVQVTEEEMAALSGDAEEGEDGEGDESSDGDATESSEEQGSEEQ